MDPKKLTTLIVASIVGVIMFSAILVPVVTDGQNNTHDTLTNTVAANKTYKLDGSDDYIFETNPSYDNYKINGQKWSAKNGTAMITDKCRVDMSGHYIALYDESGTRSSNTNNLNKNVVITYTADTKVFTYTVYTDLTNATVENSYTYNVENILYVVASGGDYGAISTGGSPDVTYYVNDLSQVIAGGAYTSGDLDTSYFAEGSTVYVGNASYTANATATTQQYDGYTDVISGSGYTVTVTDGTNTETFTPYTIFVPIEVPAHTSNDNIIIQLLGVLPIVAIMGIVIAVVGLAFAGRNDY